MIWNVNESANTSAGRVAWGQAGDGPDLVLAHGWPWSSFAWHRMIEFLAEAYRVHWFDMPGYGRSDMTPEQATGLDVQGRVFSEMLQYWGLDAPLVIAHDFGGATTLRAHLLHDCEYRALVLMNVVAMRPWGSEFFDHVGRHTEAFFGLPPHIHEAVVRAYIKGALVGDIPEQDFEGLVQPWLSEAGRISFYRQFAQADERFTAEVEEDFDKIRCPVAILWGKDDPWIPIERGSALQAAIGTDDFTELDGLGHLPQLEAPRRVTDHLIVALSRCVP